MYKRQEERFPKFWVIGFLLRFKDFSKGRDVILWGMEVSPILETSRTFSKGKFGKNASIFPKEKLLLPKESSSNLFNGIIEAEGLSLIHI